MVAIDKSTFKNILIIKASDSDNTTFITNSYQLCLQLPSRDETNEQSD